MGPRYFSYILFAFCIASFHSLWATSEATPPKTESKPPAATKQSTTTPIKTKTIQPLSVVKPPAKTIIKPLTATKQPTITPIKKKMARPLNVVTTLPFLQQIAQEIGGERVIAKSLTSAHEDPHFIKPVPSLKQILSQADCFIEVGLHLELWADLVVKSSLNSKIQEGEPGHLVVSKTVSLLEVPASLSRVQGDIHPFGNPHIWLSPSRMLPVAKAISEKLSTLDESHKEEYEKRYALFAHRLAEHFFGTELIRKFPNPDILWRMHRAKNLHTFLTGRKLTVGGWLATAKGIKYPIITYHWEFSYLADDFSLNIFAHVEEKSGVPPSPRYKNDLVKRALSHHVRNIVAASYYIGQRPLLMSIAKDIHGTVLFIDADCRPNESYMNFITRVLNDLRRASSTSHPTDPQ